MPSFDTMLKPIFAEIKPGKESIEHMRGRVNGPMPETFETTKSWLAYTTHRDPVLGMWVGYEVPNAKNPDELVWGARTIDPRTGAALPDDQLKLGSGFFYPMHYSLHLHWLDLGTWLVGLAALIMLVALVSGVVMHRKIFRELFTFRPKKATQRSTLDLHNLTGVVALPFHFFFAFTGLVIFAGTYFPVAHTQLNPLHELHEKLEAEATGMPHARAGVAAPLASVDAMVAEAQRRWADKGMAGEVGFLSVNHVGDTNSYVSVYRAGTDRIANVSDGIHFKAATGELLREDPPRSTVDNINEFLTGLHLQHFRHWLLRWFYVLGGLAGCVCIATGFVFFVEKRKREHAKRGSNGVRIVEAMAVTMVTGMLIATATVLVANRLLPENLAGRGDWEEYSFWAAWALSFVHAWWRTVSVREGRIAPAWREQARVFAGLAVSAVLLNWITTGDHLVKTLFTDTYWPVAGLDLSLLVSAGLALTAAWQLRRREGRAVRPERVIIAEAEAARG